MQIVLIGAGKVGKQITDRLLSEKHDITVVDTDSNRLNSLINSHDILCIQGNGAVYDIQLEAGVEKADVVIATTSEDEINILCCTLAKKLGAKRCIARIRNPEYYYQLGFMREELGLNMIVNPEYAAASEIMRILLLPDAAQVEVFANGRVELIEFKIGDNNPAVGIPLSDIYKKYKIKILVCTVERNGEVIIPDGSFIFNPGDRISIACDHKSAETFFKKIGSTREKIKTVMLVGGGKIAVYLAKQLVELGMEVKIIENDYKRCRELSELLSDVSIIYADGTDHITLKEEGVESVDAFAALTGIDEENMIMALYAQTKNVSKVIAKVNRGSYITLSDHIGIDSIISPKQLGANNIVGYVRAMKNSENSSNVETIYKVLDNKAEALQFIIHENTSYTDKPLREMRTHSDVIIASIVRNRKSIIPNGNDCLKKGDNVVVVTSGRTLHDLKEIFI